MGENELTAWDDEKNASNISRRKIDFADLEAAFDGRFALVNEDQRQDYGERRFNMIVELHGIIFNITFTPRGGKQRIVSARLANRKERRIYHAGQSR
ncbi:BrnT family toxin [Methylobacterium sp. J-030]|uniref:BrnT family toxin n=1 Tax=Methylobacterium sp. J-030 TaxID=2836627 RepID=UPI001FBB87DE|nr:BrnT family toxin [Methylobacterium sp. J-030]MCJ2072073.1 BrnT family toxin [Methylobacterium sp. J-030]